MKYITVHSILALEDKKWKGITYFVYNIPIINKSKVLKLYGDSNKYHIEYHHIKK